MKDGKNSTASVIPRPEDGKLSKEVLILTRTFLPVEITNVKNAMTLLCSGKAKVVDTDWYQYTFEEWVEKQSSYSDNFVIRTIRNRIEIPDVLALTRIDKPPKYGLKFSYQNIFTRDKYICQYCYESFPVNTLTVDHLVPRSRGGKSTWYNCVTACFKCNTRKADKSPEEAGMILLSKPRKPEAMFRLRFRCKQNKRWKQFVK